MGNTAYRQNNANQNLEQDLRNFMQVDLPKFVSQNRIGNGKFMKTYVMRVDSTQLVVKVYMKPPEEDLQQVASQLTKIWHTLSPAKYPNLMPYQMWIKSASKTKTPYSPVYLIRQYFHTNLYDRFSTRPFYNDLEKRWVVYQLLKCLEICHEHHIVHGDIKPENILCTTSNWLVLTDFAPYKPVCIMDDDPTEFQYYFDIMSRQHCYIAPERFSRRVTANNNTTGNRNRAASGKDTPNNSNGTKSTLTEAMDVFSVGCVIAQILLDGAPLLDLASMVQYLTSSAEALATISTINPNDDSPTPTENEDNHFKILLSRIKNPQLRAIVVSMTQKDPEKRLRISEYVNALLGKSDESTPVNPQLAQITSNPTIPLYFETCIYPLYLKLHWNGVTPDDRITILCESYEFILEQITGKKDPDGGKFFNLSVSNNGRALLSSATLESRYSYLLLPMVTSVLENPPIQRSILLDEIKEKLLERALASNSASTTKEEVSIHSTADTQTKSHEELIHEITHSLQDMESFFDSFQLQSMDEGFAEYLDLSQEDKKPFNNDNTSTANHKTTNHSLDDINYQNLTSFDSVHFIHQTHLFFALPHWNPQSQERETYEGLVLIIDLLCSNFRHLKALPSRLITLMMLGRIGRLCTDSVILQRIVPMLLFALDDPSTAVKVTSLRALTSLLSFVQTFSPIEVNYFPQYIFPHLSRLVRDSELIVRMAFAESIGSIALTAKRFLDKGHALYFANQVMENSTSNDMNGSNVEDSNFAFPSTTSFPYEHKLELLKEQISRWIRDLILDSPNVSAGNTTTGATLPSLLVPNSTNSIDIYRSKLLFAYDSAVKKVLLKHIIELCFFFGQESTMEKLLTQILTFLNEPDWELRSIFCAQLPAIAVFLGATVTSEYIVPCLENSIYDFEEAVTYQTIRALDIMTSQRLVTHYLVVEFAKKLVPLLLHYSLPIRTATMRFLVSASEILGVIDSTLFLVPMIEVFSVMELQKAEFLSLMILQQSLPIPLTREIYLSELLRELLAVSSLQSTSLPFKIQDYFVTMMRPNQTFSARLTSAASASTNGQTNNIVFPETLSSMDQKNILHMKPYLTTSAINLFNKILKWNNFLNTSTLSGGLGTSTSTSVSTRTTNTNNPATPIRPMTNAVNMTPPTLQATTQDSSLLISQRGDYNPLVWLPNNNLLENSVFSLPVPTLKPPLYISEDYRKQKIYLDNDESRNIRKINAVYFGNNGRDSSISFTKSMMKETWDESTTNSNNNNTTNQTNPSLPSQSSSSQNTNNNNNNNNTSSNASNTNTMRSSATDNNTTNNHMNTSNPTMLLSPNSISYANNSSVTLVKRLKALKVPPLPVDLGITLPLPAPEDRVNPVTGDYDYLSDQINTRSQVWRPKESVLLMTLREHKNSINRLVLPSDQTYFASASSDSTVRIWQTKALDRMTFPRSSAVYLGHKAAVVDAVSIESSHSVASASKDGSVHIWRVDMQSQKQPSDLNNPANNTQDNTQPTAASVFVSGSTLIRAIQPSDEGDILAVQHFNTEMASVVSFATQRGGIHGWDLRIPKDAFHYNLRPELGYATSMTVGSDRNWMCVGTSKGFIALWDIRYNSMSALYRHTSYSSINRLATCNSFKSSTGISGPVIPGLPGSDGAYLIVAAGNNETSVFGIPEAGECFKCFRSLSLEESKAPLEALPRLETVSIPRHPYAPITVAPSLPSSTQSSGAVRAMIGRISPSNPSYLITGGTDKHIRYWDFRSPDACLTIAGVESAQPKSIFMSQKLDDKPSGKLFVCYTAAIPSTDKILQSHLPLREGLGLLPPSPVFKDAIMDMKELEYPQRLLLSSSRDGEIKLWK